MVQLSKLQKSLVMACCFMARHPCRAETNPRPFFLNTRGTPVSQILKDAGEREGYAVIVSPNIQDLFIGKLSDQSYRALLERLASTYHLIWYLDGPTIYLYKSSEIMRATLNLKTEACKRFEQLYAQLNLKDNPSIHLTRLDAPGGFELSAPPAWIEQIQWLLKDLDEQEEAAMREQEEKIHRFLLRYAHAEDREIPYLNETLTVPGVVTMLRNILQHEEGEGSISSVPVVLADPRTNAIIVRERGYDEAKLQRLIEELDQAPQQIEIAVSIIDLDERSSRELGVQLGMNNSWMDVKTQCGEASTTPDRSNIHISAKIEDRLNFEAMLNFLERESCARILAQPSIITLNNTKAGIEKSVTMYTRQRDGDQTTLQPITTGTLLEVVPRILDPMGQLEEGKEPLAGAISLQIHIKDGKLMQNQGGKERADGLPEMQSSEIYTQAILNEGEGLLLGGFVREEEIHSTSSLPWISKIPILKSLFQKSDRQNNKLIRLFYLKAATLTPFSLTSPFGFSLDADLTARLQQDPIFQPEAEWEPDEMCEASTCCSSEPESESERLEKSSDSSTSVPTL